MMKRSKWLVISVVILVLLLAGWLMFGNQQKPTAPLGVELLINASFVQQGSDGLPNEWVTETYVQLPGLTKFSLTDGPEGQVASIISHDTNDARFAQTVKVHPDTLYRLTGFIKAKAEGGLGANLSIADVYVFTEPLFDTNGEWQPVELYGQTGKDQHEITVFMRLGGYSGESKGEAAFDKLSLMAVDAAPSGQTITRWEKPQSQAVAANTQNGSSAPLAPQLLILSLLLGFVMVLFASKAREAEELPANNKQDVPWWQLAALVLVAAAFRLIVAVKVPGFPVDIACFTAWADQIVELGPAKFYVSGIFSDYPPGYMLALWPIGMLGKLAGSGATEWMVKLPSILCDMLLMAFLYRIASKQVNPRAGFWLAALYAVNPMTYLAGAAWGQADSVPSLLLLVAVVLIIDKKWRFALPVYVLAVLMKPQSLMVGPLGLLALVLDFIWRKDKAMWKDVLIGILASLVVAAVIVLPFFNEQNGIPWLFDLYGGTMSYYSYATVNATNLFFLFGQNWVAVAQPAPFLLRLTGLMTLLLPTLLYLYNKHKTDGIQGKADSIKNWWPFAFALLPAVTALLPQSMSTFGILLMISVFALVTVLFVGSKKMTHLPLLAGVMLTGFSILGTMMHERYLFLAAALLLLAYVYCRDRRLLMLLMAVSLLCFLNSGVVLDRGVRIGGGEGNLSAPGAGLVSDSAWLEYLLSAFSLLVAGFSVYVGMVMTSAGFEPKSITVNLITEKNKNKSYLLQFLKSRQAIRFGRKDAALILLITLVYAVLAFVNLGANIAPQTSWTSDYQGTNLELDLGQTQTFELRLYWGINWRDSELTIAVSDDGQDFETTYPGRVSYGDCFAWRTLTKPYYKADGSMEFGSSPQILTGRYVRITGDVGGLTLMEVVAQDAVSGENLPLSVLTDDAQAVVDEQDTLTGPPTWFNSMYFDEIYHARTAYEQRNAILGQEPSAIYETTHPPLGKLFMTFSVMVFGMNPFGWRFAGALAGVLMLPGMYLLGKQLTGKKRYGLIAMLLMTFDFMHFTQTRIATIDSFVTLFIIYSYFFMFRYMSLDHLRTPLRKTLPLLLLSGLMMGLGIASKWTGLYAAAGLAVLFFWTLIGNAIRFQQLASMDESQLSLPVAELQLLQTKAKQVWRDVLVTCLWCLLFFVAIPLVIYYLSYIPVYMQTSGGLSVEKVIKNNFSMYNYHAEPGRGADHSFASPWWSWPINKKPMYFYSGGIKAGTASVIWSFGNPAIWWSGLISLVLVAVWAIQQLISRRYAKPNFTAGESFGKRPWVLLIAFLAQYLPWVLVPRGTYIYHYFPSIPFIILCTVLLLDKLAKHYPKVSKAVSIGLAVLAFASFVAFFPYISGLRVSTQWLSLMQWFPGWLYF